MLKAAIPVGAHNRTDGLSRLLSKLLSSNNLGILWKIALINKLSI
jgi:hypothetical protein